MGHLASSAKRDRVALGWYAMSGFLTTSTSFFSDAENVD
jgi:hypothetical protein